MRKTPTLLVGLLASGAIAGTAVAQTAGSHTLDVGVSPSKAGTAKKPANVQFKLNISNDEASKTTASKIEINLPSGLKMNPSSFPTCSLSVIEDQGVDECPSKSKLGTGTATAVLGATSATPSPLKFSNTFVVGGSKFLYVALQEVDGDVRANFKANISNGNRKLTVVIPESLQQPAPGVYSALTNISTKLKGTTGSGSKKHGFFELSKCSGGKLTVNTKITYVNNPNPPVKSSSTATDSANCKK